MQEQTEAEALPAAADAARLEAEFDVHVAQLLLTNDEAEIDHLVSSYGEGESYTSPLPELDNTRSQLVKELSRMQPGDNAAARHGAVRSGAYLARSENRHHHHGPAKACQISRTHAREPH